MTNPLSDVQAMTDAQALELHTQLLDAGQLPPPAGLFTISRDQIPASLDHLGGAIAGHASAWGKLAPDGSALAHYSNGLLYAMTMLGSCQRVESNPLTA